MARYSNERKAALLKKLLPPINMSVAELARQENISGAPLYNWLNHAKDGGAPVPGDNKLTDEWPAEAKFAVVLETTVLSEIELSEYCRRKGLYPQGKITKARDFKGLPGRLFFELILVGA